MFSHPVYLFLRKFSLQDFRGGSVTIDESELLVFCPFFARTLRRKGCDKELIDIIYHGCELEDIESLLPERHETVIQELILQTNDFIYTKRDDYPLSDERENKVSFKFTDK
ncbi:hypothetical protein AW118_25855 [Escherichia coli]|uniref:DUF3969 family protein n=1 Tax=Escherichia coli TaxID=562 RepID=UPI0008FB4856|nr:DUF3969 family protein [Escherichia coli]OTC16825.1 hypothetical protein AW073_26535 [Escherichia coli]OTE55104.1 hypothetical protein AW118_25855 [Escherichia coli]PDV42169.1 DUF3969 domain-containing protein [Escherichia coli]